MRCNALKRQARSVTFSGVSLANESFPNRRCSFASVLLFLALRLVVTTKRFFSHDVNDTVWFFATEKKYESPSRFIAEFAHGKQKVNEVNPAQC